MNTALILSGGKGLRLGGEIPKQYIRVEGCLVITYCLKTIMTNSNIDQVVIVAMEDWHQTIIDEINRHMPDSKPVSFALPGDTRQLSIYNGLNRIREIKGFAELDTVLIHDAARPFLSDKMINDCYEALEGFDGVMPVLPMKDTVYYSTDGRRITGLADRSTIFAGQAPELFNAGRYYDANTELMPNRIKSINGSSEPAVLAGMNINMIPGDESNYKITTQADLERFIKDLGSAE